jgi:hypothetical protein
MSAPSDAEVLLKIRTALESGGLDAARNALADLTAKTGAASAAAAENTAASTQQAAALDNLQRFVMGIRGAMMGSAEGTRMMANALRNIVPAAGGAAAAIGAFAGGWKLGEQLDSILGISKGVASLANALTKVNLEGRLTNAEIAKLGQQKFDGLRAEIAAMTKDLDVLHDRAQRGFGRSKAEAAAEAEAAEAAAGPAKTADQSEAAASRRAGARISQLEIEGQSIDETERSAASKRAELQAQLDAVDAETAAAEAEARRGMGGVAAKEARTRQVGRPILGAARVLKGVGAMVGSDRLYGAMAGLEEGQVTDAERTAASNAAKRARDLQARRAELAKELTPQIAALDETLQQDVPSRRRIHGAKVATSLSAYERDLTDSEGQRRKESDAKAIADAEQRLAQTQAQIAAAQKQLATEKDQAAAASEALRYGQDLAAQRNAPGALSARRQLPGVAALAQDEALDVADVQAKIADLVATYKALTNGIAELKATQAAYRP